MATLLELAELSAATYGGPLPSGWKVLPIYPSRDQIADSYLGVAYEKVDANGNPVLNPDGTIDIVIANRGTDLKNFSNLTNMMNVLSDIELAAGQKTAVQGDAAAFAASVVAYAQNNGLKANFIETGHSLGGNEAQAAVVALTNAGIPVSAVTFDSPGIGGYPYNATTAYNVTNLYTQGDAIHLAGGVHLGTSVMLPAGPNTSSLALDSPLAVATGPAGVFGLLGTALWDVLGPAHAMQTVIGYLQNTNSALGNLNSGAVGSIPSLLPGTIPTGPVMRVNPNGSLTLTDAGGNGVTFDTGATGQTVTATFTDGTGTGIYSELASLGNVTLPGSELNQNVAALTGAASINESITRNASGTFDVAFSSTGSSDQFAVTTANNSTSADTGFNYAVPSGMQTVVETIDNGDNNAPGTVSVIAGSTVTQLDGGTAVAGTDTTWTDSHGDQYVYNPDTGSMTISQGLLGTGGDQIVIDNFNLGQAESSTGYLGIKFGEQLAMAASANSADDPFTNGGNGNADISAGSSWAANDDCVSFQARAVWHAARQAA